MSSFRRITTVALALAATSAVAVTASSSADSASVPGGPASASAEQLSAFPVLREPAPETTSAWARRFSSVPVIADRYAPNPDLARPIASPTGDGSTWHLIPGRDSVCLITEESGACQSLAGAKAGSLTLELIEPNQKSRTSPLPAPGHTVRSKVYGVAPAGVEVVTATTRSGAKVRANVSDGVYAIAGTNLASLSLSASGEAATSRSAGAPIPLFAGR